MKATDEQLMETVRTILRISRFLQQVCETQGYSVQQYRALSWIDHHKNVRPAVIAEMAEVSRPAVATLISGLENKGAVVREAVVKDGRGVHLKITRKGKNTLKKLEQEMVSNLKETFGELTNILAPIGLSNELEEALDRRIAKEYKAGKTSF